MCWSRGRTTTATRWWGGITSNPTAGACTWPRCARGTRRRGYSTSSGRRNGIHHKRHKGRTQKAQKKSSIKIERLNELDLFSHVCLLCFLCSSFVPFVVNSSPGAE